jgi:hypothetical protein
LFLRELGYTNLGGGARAVDALLQEGDVERTLLQRWSASRYAPPSERIADALAATHAQVRAEQDAKGEAYRDTQRAKFKPFFQPIPELTRPSSVLRHRVRHHRRPHEAHAPAARGLCDVDRRGAGRVPRAGHPERHAAWHGATYFMGRALGYLVWRTYDGPALHVTVEGEVVGETDARPLAPRASSFGIGGRWHPGWKAAQVPRAEGG